MPRAKLRVKRRGFTAKRDGTVYRVKPSKHFLIKDRGKPGRTPKAEQWFEPKVHTGWKADMSMAKRRSLVLKAHKNDYLASGRSMQALSNIQKRINPETAEKARADALFFFRKHKQSK